MRSHARWLALSALGGGLVFLADYPAELPWLQLVAFVPLLWACNHAATWRAAASLGVVFGLARYIPLGIMLDGLGVPLPAAVALALYLVVLEGLFAISVHAMRAWPTHVFALGAGAAYAVLELVDALLPMWGTSRCLARSWAIEPEMIGGLTRLGGPFLVAFVIVALQAVVVAALVRRRWSVLAWALPLVLMVPVTNAIGAPEPTATLRVGAIAWPDRTLVPEPDVRPRPRSSDAAMVEALVAEAAEQGVRLVVLPEAAFRVEPQDVGFDEHWSEVAKRHRIHLVVPYADRRDPGNRLVVFDPDGALVGRYTKTHLIPLSETYPAGEGELLVFEVDGARVGTLICQDDNFRDLVAEYVSKGVDIIVVPTNEGPPEVAPYHYRNARLRAIEEPIALVRAAARGTSAVVAPGGEVIAATHHPTDGPRVVVADVPH